MSKRIGITQPPLFSREQAYEFALLAIVIWREAQNQSERTIWGVAWSIRNRVLTPGKTWWGDDWEDVILKKWQYSSFNPGDPNSVKFPMPDDPSWKLCLMVAESVYLGLGIDPTNGATHYYDDSIAANPPAWSSPARSQFKVKLGAMHFYKTT